jgi:hypothetical protein
VVFIVAVQRGKTSGKARGLQIAIMLNYSGIQLMLSLPIRKATEIMGHPAAPVLGLVRIAGCAADQVMMPWNRS